MNETITPFIDLTSNETRHVYSAVSDKKERPVLKAFLLSLVGAFIGLLISGLLSDFIDEFLYIILVFAAVTFLFSTLLIVLAGNSKKKTITHIIVEPGEIIFLRRNGTFFSYIMQNFINLKVTRHYYNGAYTGSTHSLLFKNQKGKQDEIQLGNMDKDLISTMFDDINFVKQYGCFYTPQSKNTADNAQQAVSAPLDLNTIENSEAGGTADRIAPVPAPDPNYPFGYSPVDGKVYLHAADLALSKYKQHKITYLLTMIISLVLFFFSIAVTVATIDTEKYARLFIIAAAITGISAFAAFLLLIITLSNGKLITKNLIKKVEFFSNCIVLTTINEKYVVDIPLISRILIYQPNRATPQGIRNLRILTTQNSKITINMGKQNSKKSYEVFGYYTQFYNDIHAWAYNHGIACVNDISQ